MKVQIITMVKDEDDIIENFINYYGKLFGYNNLFIIDNISNDNTYDICLKYKQTLIQLQKPGEKVAPHIDTLHGQIKSWIKQEPALANIEHSMEKPNPKFKARRYFIGVEDNVKGQEFILNGKHWIWKKGDCISLNVWRGVHNTANNSNKNRYIIKITGLEK